MTPTLNEKLIAYLTLISGLSISAVAVYYSVAGLTAIFAAAVVPIIIMGTVLEISKLIATVWLKQNWKIAPWSVKVYLMTAILVLMVVTSMGIFGFLSKAHSDQNLVSGDVISKIAIYDEKIKIERENIDANRKALKQMDEAVDQVMGRSQDEKGADKAVAIRRAQQKERSRIIADITTAQQKITLLNEERAPIAAEVRKVEAEVGPIKYIASFVYGETDETVLEKAVTWVIILIIVVFDPLAVILLLASQISFQNFREREQENTPDLYVADVGEKPAKEELTEGDSPVGPIIDIVEPDTTVTEQEPAVDPHPPGWMFDTIVKEKSILESHPYLNKPFTHFTDIKPIVHKSEPAYEADDGPLTEQQIVEIKEEVGPVETITTTSTIVEESLFVQNEEQKESNLWSTTVSTPITPEEYMKAIQAKMEIEPKIAKFAALVKSGRMELSSVPEEYRDDVKARI
jgi:hypothetical protein